MKLLAIETVYDVCGAAIVTPEGTIAIKEQRAPRQHNELLAPMVNDLLSGANLAVSDLDGIAVSAGPGSYTGLRIGMSYAKGLAFGADLPILPVPTLPSMLVDESLADIYWLVTWSHGEEIFAAALETDGGVGPIESFGWKAFREKVTDNKIAGYLLERFMTDDEFQYVEVCPSAEKVGKFALNVGLSAARNIDDLTPDYHHDYKPKLMNNVNS